MKMDHGFKNKVACLVAGSDVHVFQHGSHVNSHVVIRAPGTVVTASLVSTVSTSQMSSVIITTDDNQIWLVPTSCPAKDDVIRKAEHKMTKSDEPMDTDDIFQDLLSDQAKRIPEPSDFSYPKVKSFMPQSSHIATVKLEHRLFSVDGVVIDVDTFNDLVTVLVDRAGTVALQLFRICSEQQRGVCEGQNRLIFLESVTTGLGSSSFQSIYAKKNKCLTFAIPVPEVSSDYNISSASCLPVCISQQLFTVLFGKEAACLNSPVIMLCTDQGFVYSYVIKSVNVALQKSLNLICQLDSDIVGISDISVAQSIVDEASAFKDIVSALASSLKQDQTTSNNTQTRTCLVILTAAGNGCLFVPDSEFPTSLMFSLPHPIKFFIVHGTSVIYNTGKSIEACELKLAQKQDGSLSVTSRVRTLLGKARIHKLLPFSVFNEADDSVITGITCSFDLVPISLQQKVAEPDTRLQAAPSLKDLLGNIEQCSLTFKSLKRDSLYIDSFLLQLNIFASLVQNTSQKELSDRKQCHLATSDVTYPFIACKSSIQSVKNVYKRNWSLNIVLQNTSSLTLSEDWVIVVVLCDSREDLHYPVREIFNQSFSVPLSRGLKCKSNLDISLPLDKLVEIHPTPLVNITVYLSLGFRDEKRNIPQSLFNKMAKVEIHRDKIDILHFLSGLNDVNSGCDGSSVELPQSEDQWLCNELHKMADMRVSQIKEKEFAACDGSQNILSVRIGISELQCKELKLNNPSDVLSFLLKDTNIQVDKIPGQHIQVECSQGHRVTLIVAAPAADISNKSSNWGYHFVVALKGENASLLLQIREAIKSRLKAHCSDASVLNSQTSRQLRRQLTFLEGVREELRVIQKRLAAQIKDKDETAKLVCEMVDKSELTE